MPDPPPVKLRGPGDRITDRVMEGQTPLQVLARQGELPPSEMSSLERFPFYTHLPFGWFRICDADDVAPEQVLPLRRLNRDLVVWRGEDGAAHVVGAYCPHLGAHLGRGGRVEGCELICPFHWWRFDGDGRNTRIPYDGSRHPAARLESYPTVDRNGLVLAWYHPTGEPPLFEVPALEVCDDPAWTDPIRATWIVRAPWQEMAENGADFIHLRTVHGAADIPELESYELDGYQSRLRAKVNFTTPRGPVPGRIDTDSWGPGFSLARFHGILDACFVGCNTPIDFERTEVSFQYRLRKLGDSEDELERTRRLGEALVADLRRQEDEDIVIFDHKIHHARPALSKADGPIVQFRRWAAQFTLPGDPRGTHPDLR